MPNILIKVPKNVFPKASRANLGREVSDAAALVEQMPNDSKNRFLNWVVIDEIEAGSWTCGGVDMTSLVLPCIAVVYLPSGVLDEAAREIYVHRLHEAFKSSLPATESRRLVTSVILQDVTDGTWGANGSLWKLPDFAKAAGYEHLQHLVTAASTHTASRRAL